MSVPTGNPGASANGLSKLAEAIKIIQDAVNSLPIGSDPWKAAQSAISSLGRHASPADAIPGNQNVVLQNLAKNASKDQALQQVQRSLAGPGAEGGGGAPPGMPGA